MRKRKQEKSEERGVEVKDEDEKDKKSKKKEEKKKKKETENKSIKRRGKKMNIEKKGDRSRQRGLDPLRGNIPTLSCLSFFLYRVLDYIAVFTPCSELSGRQGQSEFPVPHSGRR